jgi:hypothetical protein
VKTREWRRQEHENGTVKDGIRRAEPTGNCGWRNAHGKGRVTGNESGSERAGEEGGFGR